jgi:hypothetical protein
MPKKWKVSCDLHQKLDILNALNIIEHFFFIKWFKKWILCLVTLFFKISKLWKFWMNWFFIKFVQWTCTFIVHVFVVQKNWNQLHDLMLSFLLLFKKVYFKHLIPLVYKTQKDINIISKIFKNIFINLRKLHFIY